AGGRQATTDQRILPDRRRPQPLGRIVRSYGLGRNPQGRPADPWRQIACSAQWERRLPVAVSLLRADPASEIEGGERAAAIDSRYWRAGTGRDAEPVSR